MDMETTSITTEQANTLREQCNRRIAVRDALHRLEVNPDFQKIIEDYTKDEPIRLVALLAEPTFNLSDKKEMHRAELKESMIGIARFVEWMRNVYRLADRATKTLEDLSNAEIVDDTSNN